MLRFEAFFSIHEVEPGVASFSIAKSESRESDTKMAQFESKKSQCTSSSFRSLIYTHAGIAQLVEHNLAKVGVASSSLVSRSNFPISHMPWFN